MDWLLHGGAMVGSFFLQPLLVGVLLAACVLLFPIMMLGLLIYADGFWFGVALLIFALIMKSALKR